MPNEHEDVDLNKNEGTDTDVTTDKVETEESVDWKAKYEEEQGRRKRLETKLSKSTETKTDKAPSSSDELDYGQKAFLVANGVKGDKETELVKTYLQAGKTLDDVVTNKIFLAELKELRELETSQNATPSGSKRTGNSAQDSVEYWLAKNEMPPAGMTELRQQYVNAKMKKESNKGMFYNS